MSEVLADRTSQLSRDGAILYTRTPNESLVVVRIDEGRDGDSFLGAHD